MFWGLSLKANKKYTQTVSKAFHVSQAALDINSGTDEPVQVILTWDEINYILCTLRKGKTEQVPMDLNFAEGDNISFTSQGSGTVHLVGYFMSESSDDSDIDESEEEEDEEANEILNLVEGRTPNKGTKKKIPKDKSSDSDAEEEDGESDSDDDDDDDEPEAKKTKVEKSKKPIENGKQQQKEKSQSNDVPKNREIKLSSGVKIEELSVGTGNEARPGKKIQVYYEGRLKSNNKIFDSSKQGSGFKFTLGRGEVIKGWDIGIVGMKVGGKRRIICPANVAYGAKGSPPVIPPNSTLVFDVDLKNVN